MTLPKISRIKASIGLAHLCALLALSACAPEKASPIRPGETTEAQLTQHLGQPKFTTVPSTRPQARVLGYEDKRGNCNFQVENSVVVAKTCDPAPHEVKLQYWRHRWKSLETSYKEIPESRDGHGRSQYQLSAPGAKMTVIYDPAQDRVTRVVSYGQK